jgi:hypothetical protein
MSKRSKPRSALGRTSLFGPPPILPGDNPKAYKQMLKRIIAAIGPRDFIEEIWVHDLADVTWNRFRWRRIKAAYLAAKVSKEADRQVSQLATADLNSLQGPDKDEIERYLASKLGWDERKAMYPRANQKFQELAAAAKSTLDIDYIEADVISGNFRFIERIEALIATAQDRIDQIMRELHRHRYMQNEAESSPSPKPAQVEDDQPKKIAGALVTTVPHDQ